MEFTSEAVDAIAVKALERGTGARGLRAIIEEVLLQVMYDVPSRGDIGRVIVTEDAVMSADGIPTMISRDQESKKKKSA